jgi:hypothetical protein
MQKVAVGQETYDEPLTPGVAGMLHALPSHCSTVFPTATQNVAVGQDTLDNKLV